MPEFIPNNMLGLTKEQFLSFSDEKKAKICRRIYHVVKDDEGLFKKLDKELVAEMTIWMITENLKTGKTIVPKVANVTKMLNKK